MFLYYDDHLREIERDLESKIVRIETAESKFNIEIKNLSFVCSELLWSPKGKGRSISKSIFILELKMGIFEKSGAPLNKVLKINIVFYGKNDRIKYIHNESIRCFRESSFDYCSIAIDDAYSLCERNISKILLFPTE